MESETGMTEKTLIFHKDESIDVNHWWPGKSNINILCKRRK